MAMRTCATTGEGAWICSLDFLGGAGLEPAGKQHIPVEQNAPLSLGNPAEIDPPQGAQNQACPVPSVKLFLIQQISAPTLVAMHEYVKDPDRFERRNTIRATNCSRRSHAHRRGSRSGRSPREQRCSDPAGQHAANCDYSFTFTLFTSSSSFFFFISPCDRGPGWLTYAVEAGASQGWERWVGGAGATLTVDHYVASAPGELVLEKYGFAVDNVIVQAKALLGKAWLFRRTARQPAPRQVGLTPDSIREAQHAR